MKRQNKLTEFPNKKVKLETLPIHQVKDEIISAINDNTSLVIVGETGDFLNLTLLKGSGKTYI
jgi:HrpA-like RNA helicase